MNEYDQPVGDALDWSPPAPIAPAVLKGRTCWVEPLDLRHAEELFTELCVKSPPAIWTYLAVGPFDDVAGMAAHIDRLRATPDMLPWAIVKDGRAVGIAAHMRINPPHGVLEVGSITFGRTLQRTTASTEALMLLARHAFASGYRRYEWKCDSLNAPSRRAAIRFGFVFEGVFRQDMVIKGRNRDTAWYAMTDRDWPRISAAYDAWLDPNNFDEDGRQRSPLAATLPAPDPAASA